MGYQRKYINDIHLFEPYVHRKLNSFEEKIFHIKNGSNKENVKIGQKLRYDRKIFYSRNFIKMNKSCSDVIKCRIGEMFIFVFIEYFIEIGTDIYVCIETLQKSQQGFFEELNNDYGVEINELLMQDKVDSHIECFERTYVHDIIHISHVKSLCFMIDTGESTYFFLSELINEDEHD